MICSNCGGKLETGDKFCTQCGTVVQQSNNTNITSGAIGKITITRLKKMIGALISFTVYIDGTELGALKNNTTLIATPSLGKHIIKIRSTEKDVVQEIELTDEKKEVEIIIVPKMGLIAAKPVIQEIR